jgi:hypothetical protein
VSGRERLRAGRRGETHTHKGMEADTSTYARMKLKQTCETSNRAQQVQRRQFIGCFGKSTYARRHTRIRTRARAHTHTRREHRPLSKMRAFRALYRDFLTWGSPPGQSYSVLSSEGQLNSMSVEQLKDAQIQHLRGWESAQKQQQRLACAGASLAKKANRASHAPAPELEMQVAENKEAQREVKALVEEERYRYLKISRRLDRVAGWGEVHLRARTHTHTHTSSC